MRRRPRIRRSPSRARARVPRGMPGGTVRRSCLPVRRRSSPRSSPDGRTPCRGGPRPTSRSRVRNRIDLHARGRRRAMRTSRPTTARGHSTSAARAPPTSSRAASTTRRPPPTPSSRRPRTRRSLAVLADLRRARHRRRAVRRRHERRGRRRPASRSAHARHRPRPRPHSRALDLDEVSLLATFGAGTTGPQAEELLGARGHTLGHFPQSFEFASIGGYAATRSSGQASRGYGRFDDLVHALRIATPVGELRLGRAPASAAGPDLRELFLGSEGAFGVMTDVTVRIRPLPAATAYGAWTFPDFEAGAAGLRELTQRGIRPDRAAPERRQRDARERADGRAPHPRAGMPRGGDVRGRRTRRSPTRHSPRLMPSSGVTAEPHAERSPRAPGSAGGSRPRRCGTRSWTSACSPRRWRRRPRGRTSTRSSRAVTAALTDALTAERTKPIVLCHISHVYPAGASLYFTVVAALTADPVAQWGRAKDAASRAIGDAGGTITHHHAVDGTTVPISKPRSARSASPCCAPSRTRSIRTAS